MPRSTRIAVLVRRFPKLSETFILGEISSLIGKGHDVDIFSCYAPTDCLHQPAALELSHKVTYFNQQSSTRGLVALCIAIMSRPVSLLTVLRLLRESPLRESPRVLVQLGQLIDCVTRREIRHVHCHYLSEPAALAEAMSAIVGVSFSISAHAKDIYKTPVRLAARRLASASFVSTCTQDNQRFLSGLVPQADHIHLVYHGIDAGFFRPAMPATIHREPKILAVGRFIRKKGFDLLIRACATLLDRGFRFQCQIVGYGEEQGRLKQLVSELGVAHCVQLIAPVDHPGLLKLLQDAELFVLPCRILDNGDRDGIPNSMLEAMAAGVTVVSTSVSGIPEVIRDRQNGLLVSPDSADALVGAIEEVFGDRALRQRLSEAGRSTVISQFSWHNNIATLSNLLDHAVRPQPPAFELVS